MKIKAKSKEGFYGWINLAVLFPFNMVSGALLITFGIFLPFWAEDFGWSLFVISGAQLTSNVLIGVVAPVVGFFIMRWGGKKAIITGNLINTTGLILLAHFHEVWQLYLGYGIIIGTGFSLGGMLAMNTIINKWFVKKLSVAVGIATAATGITGVLIAPLLLHLINIIGWRHTFLVFAGLIMFFCVILPALFVVDKPGDLGQVPDGPRSKQAEISSSKTNKKANYRTPVDFTAKEAFRTRALWMLLIFYTLQYFTMNWIVAHQVKYMFDIGVSSGMTGLVIGIMSTVMTIAQVSAGILAVRISMQYITLGSISILILGLIIAPFAGSFSGAVLYSIFFGIGFGVNVLVLVNLLPSYFGVSEYPKIMGYITPFYTILGSLGTLLAGHLRDITGSYMHAFQISVLAMAIAFICIIFAKPPVHPSLVKDGAALKRKVKQFV